LRAIQTLDFKSLASAFDGRNDFVSQIGSKDEPGHTTVGFHHVLEASLTVGTHIITIVSKNWRVTDKKIMVSWHS
jgi:hypothetical protein